MIGVIASVAAPLVMGAIQNVISQKTARDMEGDLQNAQGRIDDIIGGRQEVLDSSGKIRDMKSMVSNPYANLAVATQAAEMQAEQTDQALANTLDTIRVSGLGAGGATALAQAAAKSKQGISATIEQQEVNNQKLAAQGKAAVNQQLMSIEQAAIAEEGAAFGRQEARTQAELDRAYGESDFLRSRQLQIQDAGNAALMAGIAGTASGLTSGLAAGGALTKEGGFGQK